MAYYNVKSGSTVYLDLLPVKNEIDAGKLLKSVTAFWATSGARRYISGSYGPGPGVGSGPGSGTGGSGSNKSSVIGDDIGEVDDDRGRSRDKDNDNRYDNVNDAGSNVNRVDINTTSNITESNTCAAVDDSNSSRSVSSASSHRDRENMTEDEDKDQYQYQYGYQINSDGDNLRQGVRDSVEHNIERALDETIIRSVTNANISLIRPSSAILPPPPPPPVPISSSSTTSSSPPSSSLALVSVTPAPIPRPSVNQYYIARFEVPR